MSLRSVGNVGVETTIILAVTRLMKKKSKSDRRNQHAVALGKMGASKGGKARAAKLTPSKRRSIAKSGGKSGGRGRSKK